MKQQLPLIAQYIQRCRQALGIQPGESNEAMIQGSPELPKDQRPVEKGATHSGQSSQVFTSPKLDNRTQFKQAVIAGIEWFKEQRFDKALQEFQTAQQILPTDELKKLSIRCQRGMELTEQLHVLIGTPSPSSNNPKSS